MKRKNYVCKRCKKATTTTNTEILVDGYCPDCRQARWKKSEIVFVVAFFTLLAIALILCSVGQFPGCEGGF